MHQVAFTSACGALTCTLLDCVSLMSAGVPVGRVTQPMQGLDVLTLPTSLIERPASGG